MPKQKVIVIGAGLAGSLLAIYLARRDFTVEVYESRPDMRTSAAASGRSINLALSNRGIAALREIGMDAFMLREAVAMHGRMIHPAGGGATRMLPYSGRAGEYINSVSRAGLNVALIDLAEKFANVKIRFNHRCVGFDAASGTALIDGGGAQKAVKGDTLIATDGAGSAVRFAMLGGSSVERFAFAQSWLEHGYKELHIPPAEGASATERFQMEPNALHIWPRHRFMMIALPNSDGSFTCTLFLAHRSDDTAAGDSAPVPSFESLSDEKSVAEFFSTQFPDAVALMPTLIADFFANPVGNLGTIKCFPWNVDGRSLLLGDAAHAIVPFYGQGMNCAFEDVRVLDALIERFGADWEIIFDEFGRERKINTDAIADMAEENFNEMRDAVADPVFIRKRQLETLLEQKYPDYYSKYSMVTFRDDLPYAVAKDRGGKQDRLLMKICADAESAADIDTDAVMARLASYDEQR